MDELDAYSRTVSSVAATVGPAVAAVDTGHGSGSAVVVDEGVLVTNAHVVGDRRRARAAFGDGSECEVRVLGADRLSDLAVLHTDDELGSPSSSVTPRASWSGSSWWPSATRWASRGR